MTHTLTVTRTTTSTVDQPGPSHEAFHQRIRRLKDMGDVFTAQSTLSGYEIRFTDSSGAVVVLAYEEAQP